VTAYERDGSVSSFDSTGVVGLRLGNQYADLVFSPPLPVGKRYCIRLAGVTDLAGNELDAESGRIDLVLQPGDVTGDMRVTVNDAGALVTLLGTMAVDPFDPYQVRCDIDGDGAITNLDLAMLLGNIGRNWTGFVTPCSTVHMRSTTVAGSGGGGGTDTSVGTAGAGGSGRAGAGVGKGAAGERADVGSAGGGRAEKTLTGLLSVVGGVAEPCVVRADLLAVEQGIDPASIEEFALERLAPGCDPCEWDVYSAGGHPLSYVGARTLHSMLEAAGVRTATVVQRGDKSLAIVLPEVRLLAREDIPADWVRRAIGAALSEELAASATADGGAWTVPLDGRSVPAILDAVRRLGNRSEFGAVHVKVLDVHVNGGEPSAGETSP
jgi:hypothetical protein